MEQLARQGSDLLDNEGNQTRLGLNALPIAQFVLRQEADYLLASPADTAPRHHSPVQLELDLDWEPASGAAAVGRVSPRDLQATHRLLKAITEVMDGRRSPLSLDRHLDPSAYLALQAIRRISATGHVMRLRSLHAFQPIPGAIEACATVEQGRRARAMAARLQLRRIGWMCMRLAIL